MAGLWTLILEGRWSKQKEQHRAARSDAISPQQVHIRGHGPEQRQPPLPARFSDGLDSVVPCSA